MNLDCGRGLLVRNGGVYGPPNWRAHWLQRCIREARKKWRNQGNGSICGRSSAANRAADCGISTAQSSDGPLPASRSRRGWHERAALERIAALQAGLNTQLRYCPDDRSTWRYESFRLRERRLQLQYLPALDCPESL